MDTKLFVLVVALVAQTYAYPSETRTRRQAVAGAYAGAGGMGTGAVAGVGGNDTPSGITVGSASGTQKNPTRTNQFLPWRVFAGLNLGQGGRIGAGCAGLNCGFQLGNFGLSTGQLFGNQGNPGYYDYDDNSQGNGYYNGGPNSYAKYPQNNGYYNNYNPYNDQQSFSSSPNFNAGGLLQMPFRMLQQFQHNFQNQPNGGNFARFGGGNGGQYFGGASTSTFGSSGNGRKPVFSSTSVHVDPEGKVTAIESGSDQQDKITTGRIGGNTGTNGVFAASGTQVDSNGNVNSFRNVGAL